MKFTSERNRAPITTTIAKTSNILRSILFTGLLFIYGFSFYFIDKHAAVQQCYVAGLICGDLAVVFSCICSLGKRVVASLTLLDLAYLKAVDSNEVLVGISVFPLVIVVDDGSEDTARIGCDLVSVLSPFGVLEGIKLLYAVKR